MTTEASIEMESVIVLGAHWFAEEVADIVAQTPSQTVVGFVEGLDRQRCARPLLGLPVWWIDQLDGVRDSCRGICAVGSPQREGFIAQGRDRGLEFTTVVHPSAQIAGTSRLETGAIVSPGVIIASHTRIGPHVIVNRGSLIGHHVEIGPYATVSPGVNIGGKTRIGASSFLGMGSIVIDGISVGRGSLIAAGAVVVRDVPDGERVAGVPAKPF
jgi:sugar O-acyltransferase (sialic acid O-acetyltransferase NeuD family)